MLLLIDAGNSRIKWAVVAPVAALGDWTESGSLRPEELVRLAQIGSIQRVERILISNVAGDVTRNRLQQGIDQFGVKPEWLVSQPALAGVRNLYRDPARLGCDRFAAAIGARALFPGRDLVVATCGTATTIDAVSATGDFLGGMILPGLEIMAQALSSHTAQLPLVAPDQTVQAGFGDHTEAAMIGGCLAAQAGAIEYAVREMTQRALAGGSDLPLCLLAGGAADYVAGSIRIPFNRIDNLVLTGLQVISSC